MKHHAQISRRLIACSIALLLLPGCNQNKETLDELIDRAGELPAVRASEHSKLREEFRLVEQSQTLPKQLNTDASLVHKNAAVALAAALDDMELVLEINGGASAFLGALPAADAKFVMAESGALSAKWLSQTTAVAKASELPGCDFELKFERGYFNKLDFLYQAAAASRLLLIDALYNVQQHPNVALGRFDAAWRWTNWLEATGHLEARVQAALVRGDALNVAEVIANQPTTTKNHLRILHRTLDQSIHNAPSIESTLVRERALALATYESVRLGLTDMLFTIEERSQLREDGVYESLREATDEQVDADEAAYLIYMREVISVAKKPYFMRSKHLVECDRLLRASEHVESYPWFANHLFVLNNSLTRAQAEVARGQGRVEGWLHLLAQATGMPPPENDTNPLNGEKYVTSQQGSEWYIALGDRRSVNPRLTVPGQ